MNVAAVGRADAMRAVAHQGKRCWRCAARLCLMHAWGIGHPEGMLVVCEPCFLDVKGTIALIDERLGGRQ